MHNNKRNKTLLEHYYLFSLQKTKQNILRFFFVFGKSSKQKIPRQAFWFTDQINVKNKPQKHG